MKRRHFLQLTAGATALGALGEFGFLAGLPRVSAAEARLEPGLVRLHPEIEPLVRFLEDTPRERLFEEVAQRLRHGLTYRELLAALLMAGVRNIEPRPVGFKFHAVLVINSAHLASLASPDTDRWLPLFWALDQFKRSQAANQREGGWRLGPVDEPAVPPSHRARQAFIDAMEKWDEAAADVAMAGLARTAGAHEIFELLCRYGVRDFHEIGHKQIYVSNSFRTLEAIGWQHAEPVLRSLVYALLDRDQAKQKPAPAHWPGQELFQQNLEAVQQIRQGWLDGAASAEATTGLLETWREASPAQAAAAVVQLLNRGVAPRSIYDALFDGAGELLMRAPGILSLHATTFTNATHYAWLHARDEETRRLLLLQNAAFLPLFRGERRAQGTRIDALEPAPAPRQENDALEDIFLDLGRDRLAGARKILAYLQQGGSPKPLADAARRLIFLKGTDSHDYKYSSAVLEDYAWMSGPCRERYLAASAFYFKGTDAPDNELVNRARAALRG